MHPLCPRHTLSGALADSRTPPPKSLFSAEGGWEEVEAQAAQTMERKSECGQLRGYLAGGLPRKAGARSGARLPRPQERDPHFQLCRWGVPSLSPDSPFLLPSLPPSGLFFLNFLLSRSHPLLPTVPLLLSPPRT